MTGLFLLQFFAPETWTPFLREWLYFPLAVQMVWNVLFIVLLVPALILIVLVLRRLRPTPRAESPALHGMSRRKFVYLLSCAAAPVAAVGMGVHGTLTRDDLRVRRLTVPMAGLPPQWEGFTIAHVSDIHSGVFCGPDRLKLIGDTVNDLKANLITITGDSINHSMAEFPDVIELVRRLESPQGIWFCEGNHDHPNTGEVVRACAENNLGMLYNSTATIPFQGARLLLAGLPWMNPGLEVGPDIVTRLYPERQSGDLRVLLAHHPHLFDIAESTDLVLSGHTHGGQIMAAPDVGLGPIFFRYWSGLYRKDRTAMVVSNGCGDWFPCRIGAPAEIGLLTLTNAA
jgi:predicted MPP superfamily phosphohydrolase